MCHAMVVRGFAEGMLEATANKFDITKGVPAERFLTVTCYVTRDRYKHKSSITFVELCIK